MDNAGKGHRNQQNSETTEKQTTGKGDAAEKSIDKFSAGDE